MKPDIKEETVFSLPEEVENIYFQSRPSASPDKILEQKKNQPKNILPPGNNKNLIFIITSVTASCLIFLTVIFINNVKVEVKLSKKTPQHSVAARLSEGEKTLFVSNDTNSSRYQIRFKKPVDLTKYAVKYKAKGSAGGEAVIFSITDFSGGVYKIISKTQLSLTKTWQSYSINIRSLKTGINIKDISTIQFEIDNAHKLAVNNKTVFLKDVALAKK